jgi:transcriptional regulator with XRE-family HTH domain
MEQNHSRPAFGSSRYWRETGLRLRITRLTLCLSEAEAAAGYGVTLRTYRKWEAGRRQTNSPVPFCKFGEAFDVSLDWIVFGKGYGLRRHRTTMAAGKLAILPIQNADDRRLRGQAAVQS